VRARVPLADSPTGLPPDGLAMRRIVVAHAAMPNPRDSDLAHFTGPEIGTDAPLPPGAWKSDPNRPPKWTETCDSPMM